MKNTVLLFLVIALLVHIVPVFTSDEFVFQEHIAYYVFYSMAFLSLLFHQSGKRWLTLAYSFAIIYPLYDHFTGLIDSVQRQYTVGIIACLAVWIFLPIGAWLVWKRE